MSTYTKSQLARIRKELKQVQQRYEDLLYDYQSLQLSNAFAAELAMQGFLRRLGILRTSIENVFRIIPPNYKGFPSRDELKNCEINLHAFFINVFGALDNLALIWVHQRRITNKKGKNLSPFLIGFGEKCVDVRESLSPTFQRYLNSKRTTRWFAYLEDYRHSLAHRVPLYIPPFTVPDSKNADYWDLEQESYRAMMRGDDAEYDRLQREQKKLGKFLPVIKHSYEERSRPLYFHPQLLADFKTVENFARRMLKELK